MPSTISNGSQLTSSTSAYPAPHATQESVPGRKEDQEDTAGGETGDWLKKRDIQGGRARGDASGTGARLARMAIGLKTLPETCTDARQWGAEMVSNLTDVDPETCEGNEMYETIYGLLRDFPEPCDGTGWTAEERASQTDRLGIARKRFGDCSYDLTRYTIYGAQKVLKAEAEEPNGKHTAVGSYSHPPESSAGSGSASANIALGALGFLFAQKLGSY